MIITVKKKKNNFNFQKNILSLAIIARLRMFFWTVTMVSLARFWLVKMLKTNKTLTGIHEAAERDHLICILRI